jgi:hypothetical protein
VVVERGDRKSSSGHDFGRRGARSARATVRTTTLGWPRLARRCG